MSSLSTRRRRSGSSSPAPTMTNTHVSPLCDLLSAAAKASIRCAICFSLTSRPTHKTTLVAGSNEPRGSLIGSVRGRGRHIEFGITVTSHFRLVRIQAALSSVNVTMSVACGYVMRWLNWRDKAKPALCRWVRSEPITGMRVPMAAQIAMTFAVVIKAITQSGRICLSTSRSRTIRRKLLANAWNGFFDTPLARSEILVTDAASS